MNILVLIKMVPDIVEELDVGPDGTSLDYDAVRPIISERDDHALEQALLLKDRVGGAITAVALDSPDVEDVLFTALAKGVDRAVKVEAADAPRGTAEAAARLGQVVVGMVDQDRIDLILTGCQAIDDLDGLVAPIVAERLKAPYLGIVTGVASGPGDGRITVLKEYAGGVRGEYEVTLPAVLGVQAAEKPPRYVPVAKVRATMKSGRVDTLPAPAPSGTSPLAVLRMTKPEATGHAEMLEGSPEAVATKVAEVLAARGLL